jgi:photosystem I subunit PsaO
VSAPKTTPIVSRSQDESLVESPTRDFFFSQNANDPDRALLSRSDVRSRFNRSESKTFDDDWLKADVTVHLLTLFGWTVPSGIAIKSYGDTSLLAAFSASIGENLANFPQGPGLEDKFWLYLLTWHIGLFSTMLLGQIGWQGRKQGYFK